MKTPDLSMFEQPGPQITEAEYGREPSLSEIVTYYYTAHGIDREKAEKLMRKYASAWLVDATLFLKG